MTNIDSILQSRYITLPTKVSLIKTVVFPVAMYGCESWTIKKVEHRRIDAFELCWRRLLRVPWMARSNHSTLKEINPEYSLEGLMLKLKFQYTGHLMRGCLIRKDPMLGKIESKRRRGRQRLRWLDSITDSVDMNLSKHQEIVEGQRSLECCSSWGSQRVGQDLVTEHFNLTTGWCYCFKNRETKASSLNRHTTYFRET